MKPVSLTASSVSQRAGKTIGQRPPMQDYVSALLQQFESLKKTPGFCSPESTVSPDTELDLCSLTSLPAWKVSFDTQNLPLAPDHISMHAGIN